MKFGPVTSGIYDRIKASRNPGAHPTSWSQHITKSGLYQVTLSADPGDFELSLAETRLLEELFALDGVKGGFELAEETPRDFPEWQDPVETSVPIEIAGILEALRVCENDALHTESAIAGQRAARDLAI